MISSLNNYQGEHIVVVTTLQLKKTKQNLNVKRETLIVIVK